MNQSVLASLGVLSPLSEQEHNYGTIPLGSYALNRITSGNYTEGIPIGAITQVYGEESTAKTVFVTHALREAQKLGYYTALIDSENAYSVAFARLLGLDPENLIYTAPETLEDCFVAVEKIVEGIRAVDKDTPIVIGYDSIAVSPSREEFELDLKKQDISERYDSHNMQGAKRALSVGGCLRKVNPLMRKEKVALMVVNQIRSKIGVMFGNPETKAAGGNALKFYIGVDMKAISNKTSDLIKDELDNPIGIKGKVRNTKNKYTKPYQECEFKLLFDEGLDPYYGLLGTLIKDKICYIPSKGWRGITNTEVKFRESEFVELLLESDLPEFQELRTKIGI